MNLLVEKEEGKGEGAGGRLAKESKGVSTRHAKGVGSCEIEQLSHVIAPHLEAAQILSSGNYTISRPFAEVTRLVGHEKDWGLGQN